MVKWFTKCIWLIPFVLFSTAEMVKSQMIPTESAIGVDYSIVPVLGFNSDYGFIGGGLLQRLDYGEGVRPFVNSTIMELTASTKGNLVSRLYYEQTSTFGTDIRSRLEIQALRLLSNTYFGIGNSSTFNSGGLDDGYYYFEDRNAGFEYQGRKRLLRYSNTGFVEGLLLAAVSYSNPLSTGDETLFANIPPPGAEGGWVNRLGIGVITDNRNDEFNPESGFRVELIASGSASPLGSDYTFGRYVADLRHYVRLFENVVIAQKLEVQHTAGDTPFWQLAAIGNDEGLRGYALNRFRGDTSVLHILELRTWLFGFFDDQIRLGANLFMDSGRVFSGSDEFSDIQHDIKQSFGISGVMSLINPDFIFRGDIGFSDEILRIYIGIGYLF